MFAKHAFELVGRCFEQMKGLITKEELKDAFIQYVFGTYQEEVVALYGLEAFYDHLEQLRLSNCRKDFDIAVEEWFSMQVGKWDNQANYHDLAYHLVKETVIRYRPKDRDELFQCFLQYLTDPNEYMQKWREGSIREASTYYRYLRKLGITSHDDIKELINSWLIEHPHAFRKEQQDLFARPPRRGRPNNLELTILMEKAKEWKPSLTEKERERIRKIYYYHRDSLTVMSMLEKFRQYVLAKESKRENETAMTSGSSRT